MKTKKKYKKPQITICQVQAKASLMESSGGYGGGGAYLDSDKQHFA